MSAVAIGKELVAPCQAGKNMEAIEKFYSPDIVSVEAMAMPNIGQTQKGIEAIKGKNTWWVNNHEAHGGEVFGPIQTGTNSLSILSLTSRPNIPGSG